MERALVSVNVATPRAGGAAGLQMRTVFRIIVGTINSTADFMVYTAWGWRTSSQLAREARTSTLR